jgi:hypothetical protein
VMVLIIGDVPAIDLSTTGTSSSTGPDPLTATLPAGTTSTSSEVDTPATTPEPTTWILGIVGCTTAAAGNRLRRLVGHKKKAVAKRKRARKRAV